MSSRECLQKLCRDEFFLFIYDLPKILHEMKFVSKYCKNNIIPLRGSFLTEYLSIGFKKGSPYKKLISIQ